MKTSKSRHAPSKLAIAMLLLFFARSHSMFAQTGIVYIGPDALNSTSVAYFINFDGTGNNQIQLALVGIDNAKWARNGALIVAQGTSSNGGRSPDVFTFNRSGGSSLHRVTSISLTGYTVEELFPALSPDSKTVVVNMWLQRTDDGAQCVVSAVYSITGVLEQTLAGGCGQPGTGNGFAGRGVDWSPKASLIVSPLDVVVQCGPTLVLPVTEIVAGQPVSGSKPTPLTQPNPCLDPLTQIYDGWPVFSPDGTKVAYLRWFINGSGGSTAVRVVNVNGTNDQQVAFFSGELEVGISWSPSGTRLLFDRSQIVGGVPQPGSLGLWEININGTGLAQLRGPQALSPNWAFNNPAPVLNSISPTALTAGSAAFTLTANGVNFVKGAVVRWNGANRTTTFINSKQLRAAIPASDVAIAGTANVTVFNPGPGGGTSNSLIFTINP